MTQKYGISPSNFVVNTVSSDEILPSPVIISDILLLWPFYPCIFTDPKLCQILLECPEYDLPSMTVPFSLFCLEGIDCNNGEIMCS